MLCLFKSESEERYADGSLQEFHDKFPPLLENSQTINTDARIDVGIGFQNQQSQRFTSANALPLRSGRIHSTHQTQQGWTSPHSHVKHDISQKATGKRKIEKLWISFDKEKVGASCSALKDSLTTQEMGRSITRNQRVLVSSVLLPPPPPSCLSSSSASSSSGLATAKVDALSSSASAEPT